tara:strand:- start:820 stop:1512 length:693 start_codon:yes stop_codon:yes gene_type:complete
MNQTTKRKMYIPTSDAGFNSWITNFATLLTADPTAVGETAGTAVVMQADADAWTATYTAASDPITRTSPAVAAKDNARFAAQNTARPIAMRINANIAVTDQQRSDYGLTIRKTIPTPIPAPTSFPQLTLRKATPLQHTMGYTDSDLGTGKAKPFGVVGVQIYRAVGTVEATDPGQAFYNETVTKAPFTSNFGGDDVGKVCTYFARYVTKAGPAGKAQVGPWSAAVNVFVI